MSRFEVFIPAAETTGFNVTFRVDADNWMAALKTGMQKLGEQGATVQNILVDIQDDNSVHVTESASGRVFRIRELTEAEAQQAQVKRGAAPSTPPPPASPGRRPTVAAPTPAPVAAPRPPTPAERPGTTTLIGAPAFAAEEAAPAPAARPANVAAQNRAAPPPLPAAQKAPTPALNRPKAVATPAQPASQSISQIGRRRHKASEANEVVELEAPTTPIIGKIGRAVATNQKEQIEDLLAEVFERVQDVYSRQSADDALYFLLDLALEKIPAESGTIFSADAASGDLSFKAVRGPRAQELLAAKLVVPSGTGVVGFCAVEGVSLALSDVQKDPRYYAAVAEKVNYTPKSILCAPMMTAGRAFGALQILNKRDNTVFNAVEVGLASYIAHQAAMYLNSR